METSSQKPSFGQGLELAVIIEKAIANAVKKTNADSDKVQKLIGKPGVIFNFFEDLLAAKAEQKPSILRLISGGEKIMIEASDGQATIANAKSTFKSFIDTGFRNWRLNISGPATPETLLDVYEITADANFAQIFTGLNTDLDKLVLTQAQIIRFCVKHPTQLRQEGYGTFFLIKVNGEYFVVGVRVFSGGLGVRVNRFEYDRVWSTVYLHRFVVPQLIS